MNDALTIEDIQRALERMNSAPSIRDRPCAVIVGADARQVLDSPELLAEIARCTQFMDFITTPELKAAVDEIVKKA